MPAAFAALPIPQDIAQTLLSHAQTNVPNITWHHPHDLHLTLKHWGAAHPDEPTFINRITKHTPTPFELTLEPRLECWQAHGRTALVVPVAPQPKLRAWLDTIDEPMRHPHISLAYCDGDTSPTPIPMPSLHVAVTEWATYGVSLNPTQRYTFVQRFLLKA